jgi:uncharacterized protein (TIGR00251 family)
MLVKVRAKPKSKKEGVKKLAEEFFEVRVNAPPEKGRANERIRELLAEYFGVPKSRVRLIRGETSRDKVFEVEL